MMKKILEYLIDDVYTYIEKEIEENSECYENLSIDEKESIKVGIYFTKLAFFTISKQRSPRTLLQIERIFEQCGIAKECQVRLIDLFFNKLRKALKKYNSLKKMDINDEILFYRGILLKESEQFLVFEEADDDDIIDRDHFLRDDKIEAEDFMKFSTIDEDVENDLKESIQDFELIDTGLQEISYEYIQKVINVIKYFILSFKHDGEFANINEALIRFMDEIPEYDLEDMSYEKRLLLKEFISNFIKDLIKYVRVVVFEKSTYDINYLDASINAAVLQLQLVLEED